MKKMRVVAQWGGTQDEIRALSPEEQLQYAKDGLWDHGGPGTILLAEAEQTAEAYIAENITPKLDDLQEKMDKLTKQETHIRKAFEDWEFEDLKGVVSDDVMAKLVYYNSTEAARAELEKLLAE